VLLQLPKTILESPLFDSHFSKWIIAILIFGAGLILNILSKKLIIPISIKFLRLSKLKIDDNFIDIIKNNITLPILYSFFYLALRYLSLNHKNQKFLYWISIPIIAFVVLKFLGNITDYAFHKYSSTHESDVRVRSFQGLLPMIKGALIIIILIFIFDNLGFKVSSIVTGLGVTGIAVAFATQALLRDLFSYFAILADKPFEIGDFIIVEDILGTIEHLGVKTVRIRSLTGEEIVCPNSFLTDTKVKNFKRMQQRRIVFKFGVVYETTIDNLKKIPETIKNIIDNVENTNFDRCHFNKIGDYSLDFECVYYVLDREYLTYMNAQEKINLQMIEQFLNMEIVFSYPTQVIQLEDKKIVVKN